MFPLMRLPNELIIRVVNLVHPADIESLVLCNKSMNRFAQEALACHLKMKRKYSVITLKSWKELVGSNLQVRNDELKPTQVLWFNQSIFALMEESIRNGDIAYYPVELHLPFDAFMHAKRQQILLSDKAESEDYYSQDQDQIASRKSFLIVRDYLRNMPLLSKEDKAEWSVLFHTPSNKDICAALLFILLPNIQSVTLDAGFYGVEQDYIKTIIEYIADTNRSSNIGSKSSKYLSKLRTVTFKFENPAINTLEAILPFAMLPSVQSLKGKRIRKMPCEQVPMKWPSSFLTCHSTVTEISFTQSAIGAQHFRSFLAGIAALQRFTYEHDDGPGRAKLQPLGIVQALEEFAAKSLISLDLTACWYGQPFEIEEDQYVKRLQKLSALKFLRIDEKLFEREACTRKYLEEKDESKIDIEIVRDWMVDILPGSLDDFTILTWHKQSWPVWGAWMLFRDHHLPLTTLSADLIPYDHEYSAKTE